MKVYIISFFLILSVLSCSFVDKKKNLIDKENVTDFDLSDSLTIIRVPELTGDTPLDMGNLVDSVSYVSLELTDKSILGTVTQVEYFDEKFFVLDAENSQSLFTFDATGKYLWKIERIGNGPGEYASLNNFSIDYSKKQIHLLSLNPKVKILIFDFNGNFISEKKIPFFTNSFAFLPDNSYIFCNSYRRNKTKLKKEFNIIKTDMELGPINVYEPYSSEKMSDYPSPSSNFYTCDQHLFYFDDSSGKIYSIDKEKLRMRYQFDFGSHTMDFSMRYLPQAKFDNYLKTSNIYHLTNVVESSNALCFSIFSQKNVSWGFYLKKSGRLLIGDKILNPIQSTVSMQIKSSFGNRLISVFDPSTVSLMKSTWLSMSLEKKKRNVISGALLNILKNYQEDSNPVLALYSLKN